MSLSPKPVAYYPLGDQDAFNGADYLVPNSSLKDYVFDFNPSSSDYIQINNGSSLTNGFSELTVSIWANFSTAGSSQQQIISKDDTNQRSWILRKLSSGVNFLVSTDGTSSSQTLFYPSSSITTGKWYHFVGVYDGSNVLLYVNGVPIGSPIALTGSLPNTTSGLYIGSYAYNSGTTFDGFLSNAQIFNTALPATGSNSIETLYNNGSPLTSMSGFTSLQGWWKLDASATYDSSTTTWTIPDDSTNSNNGTSSGMTQANLVQSDLSFTSGYSPYALDFDAASGDYINCGNDSSLNLTSQITGSVWAKFEGFNNAKNYGLISNFDPNIGRKFTFIYYPATASGSRKLRLRINSSNGTLSGYFETNIDLSDDKWHHLAFTFDGTTNADGINLYVDGIRISSFTASNPGLASSTGSTLIGSYLIIDWYMNGYLSNASIWNTALTSAQVTEIYNEGVPSNLNNNSAYSNLVSWWQLGSNTSWVDPYWIALDEKGTNNGQSQNVAAPNNMGEDAIVDGVGSYANGLSLGMSGDEVVGDAPYSSSNALSVNMDVLDRVEDTPS